MNVVRMVAIGFLLLATTTASAVEYAFPADAGIIDVKRDLGAKGDGKTNSQGGVSPAVKAIISTTAATVAPTLITAAIWPADQSTIALDFNDPLNPETVAASSFSLKPAVATSKARVDQNGSLLKPGSKAMAYGWSFGTPGLLRRQACRDDDGATCRSLVGTGQSTARCKPGSVLCPLERYPPSACKRRVQFQKFRIQTSGVRLQA